MLVLQDRKAWRPQGNLTMEEKELEPYANLLCCDWNILGILYNLLCQYTDFTAHSFQDNTFSPKGIFQV